MWNVTWLIKLLGSLGHVTCIGETRNTYTVSLRSVKETDCLGGINTVFKGSGMQIGFIWLRVGCGVGQIWTNGVFHEKWSITCLARWLSGSYKYSAPGRVMCSVLSTHTHTQFWAMFLYICHLSNLFISVARFLQSLTKFWNCFAFSSVQYLCTHIGSRYIYGVEMFCTLLPNWSLLFKLSILHSIFMRFKYCVAACMELLEKFG